MSFVHLLVVKSGASSQSTNDAPLFPLASFNVINYVLVVKKLLELNKTEEKVNMIGINYVSILLPFPFLGSLTLASVHGASECVPVASGAPLRRDEEGGSLGH